MMSNFQPQTTSEQAKELARLGAYLPPEPSSISNMNKSSSNFEPEDQLNASTIISSPSSAGLNSLTTDSLTKLNNFNNDLLIKLRFLLKLEKPPLPEGFIKAILEVNSFPNMRPLIETIREFLEKTV